MMNKLVILLACLGLAFQQTSCTSKDSQAESEVAADVDSADLETLEGEGTGEIVDENAIASDQLPEDALGETAQVAEAPEASEPAEAAPVDVPAAEALPPDPFADTVATSTPPPAAPEEVAPPADTPTTMVESTTTTETTTTIVDPEPVKKVSAPLQKIAASPWKVGKTWYNTVYFARPGDSLSSISQMIYGSDKTKELIKGNPTYNARDIRPGDKVYYNSPHRSDDASRLLTYYEDNGIAPEVYIAKPGENIRKVAKELLGYDGAWKEVWASNTVESKGSIDEATELRYWKGGAVAAAPPAPPTAPAAVVAQEPVMPPPPVAEEIPAPPMPEQQQAAMDMPPPPPEMPEPEQMAPPPPPPVEAMNPPVPQEQAPMVEEGTDVATDQDTTMALAVVGLAAAGLAVLIVMRKKRKQRDLDQQAMDNTHVGT